MNKKFNAEGIPEELKKQERWFSVRLVEDKKIPPKGWNTAQGQKAFSACLSPWGFDITPKQEEAPAYFVLDFDHVLNAKGDFVNDEAASLK